MTSSTTTESTACLLQDLRSRGLLAQCTDESVLSAHLREGARTLYCGFDPTAPSLHIGNLVPLLALRRFQLAGHRPIVLVGGATGMIGDPSGKSEERNLNSSEVVAEWTDRIKAQVAPFFDFDGSAGAVLANNYDWTQGMSVVEFLRDVGKHFSINAMIQRESVKNRIGRVGEGISYTEFSYMVLQAMDYLHLAREHGCSLQIGGSDQWGNIVSGVDLVRRVLGREAHAATLPLVTRADGTKFGKTAGGAVWLDPERTSPYSFYQFWLNTADPDAVSYLKKFTFLPPAEIEALAAALAAAPHERAAQRALARSVTALVHGEQAVSAAERISAALFAGDVETLTGADLAQLAQDGMARTELAADAPIGVLDLLVSAGLAASRGAARKLIQGGGVRINGQSVVDPEADLRWSQALHGRYHLIRRGKKTWHLVEQLESSG